MDRFAICIVDSGGPKVARVESYSPGGASAHNFNRICQVAPMYQTSVFLVRCFILVLVFV